MAWLVLVGWLVAKNGLQHGLQLLVSWSEVAMLAAQHYRVCSINPVVCGLVCVYGSLTGSSCSGTPGSTSRQHKPRRAPRAVS